MITRENAQDIATQYLAEQIRGLIEVLESVPQNVYNRDQLLNSWAVRVPHGVPTLKLEYDRIILISKETGAVIFDGKV